MSVLLFEAPLLKALGGQDPSLSPAPLRGAARRGPTYGGGSSLHSACCARTISGAAISPCGIPSENRRCLCDRSRSLQTSWKKILHSRKRILPTRPKSAAHVMNINTEGLVEKITRVPSSDMGSEPRRGSRGDQWTQGTGVWLRGGGGSLGRPPGVIWGRVLC